MLLNYTESVQIRGILQKIVCKKQGRVSSVQLRTQDGEIEVKASKFLRLPTHSPPQPGVWVELKVFKKVEAGKIKLKAFGLNSVEAPDFSMKSCDLPPDQERELLLCQSSACRKRGSQQLWRHLTQQQGADTISIKPSQCLGLCKQGPAAQLLPHGTLHSGLDLKKAAELLGS